MSDRDTILPWVFVQKQNYWERVTISGKEVVRFISNSEYKKVYANVDGKWKIIVAKSNSDEDKKIAVDAVLDVHENPVSRWVEVVNTDIDEVHLRKYFTSAVGATMATTGYIYKDRHNSLYKTRAKNGISYLSLSDRITKEGAKKALIAFVMQIDKALIRKVHSGGKWTQAGKRLEYTVDNFLKGYIQLDTNDSFACKASGATSRLLSLSASTKDNINQHQLAIEDHYTVTEPTETATTEIHWRKTSPRYIEGYNANGDKIAEINTTSLEGWYLHKKQWGAINLPNLHKLDTIGKIKNVIQEFEKAPNRKTSNWIPKRNAWVRYNAYGLPIAHIRIKPDLSSRAATKPAESTVWTWTEHLSDVNVETIKTKLDQELSQLGYQISVENTMSLKTGDWQLRGEGTYASQYLVRRDQNNVVVASISNKRDYIASVLKAGTNNLNVWHDQNTSNISLQEKKTMADNLLMNEGYALSVLLSQASPSPPAPVASPPPIAKTKILGKWVGRVGAETEFLIREDEEGNAIAEISANDTESYAGYVFSEDRYGKNWDRLLGIPDTTRRSKQAAIDNKLLSLGYLLQNRIYAATPPPILDDLFLTESTETKSTATKTTQDKHMNPFTDDQNPTRNMLTTALKQGAGMAVAVKGEDLIYAQARKVIGEYAPEFLEHPASEQMIKTFGPVMLHWAIDQYGREILGDKADIVCKTLALMTQGKMFQHSLMMLKVVGPLVEGLADLGQEATTAGLLDKSAPNFDENVEEQRERVTEPAVVVTGKHTL